MDPEYEQPYAFNPEETKKIEQKQIYKQYKCWLKQNGVLIDESIIYPAYFGDKNDGVIGVAASKPISNKKAVIGVPYDLIITVEKVKANEKLNNIIKENPQLFKISDESAFGILLLYVCYELTKKQKSFYFPYFAVADDIALTNWSHWEMLAIENVEVIRLMKHQKQQIQRTFMAFLTIFRRYPDVFPENLVNSQYKQICEKAYNFICTRAFGWSLPSISLIPMADSLNHNNQYVNHMLVDTQLQKEPHTNYTPKNKKINLTLLNSKIEKPQDKIQQCKLNKRSKTKRLKFIEKHKEILKPKQPVQTEGKAAEEQHNHILMQQYKAGIKNMRQLHFYESSCSEDNDTDEQAIQQFQFTQEKLKFYQKYESPGLTDKTKKKALLNYWQLHTDLTFEDQFIQDQQQQQKILPSKEKVSAGQIQSQKSSNVSSTSSQSSDQDQQFKWMTSNPQSHNHKTTYFIMSTRKAAKQKQQLYNFYGRRSNRFLLVGYNFVLDDNKYDSFAFRIALQFGQKKNIFMKSNPSALIYRSTGSTAKQMFSKEIRIKRQKICLLLINHCRALLIGWTDKVEQKGRVTIMIPFSIEFQGKVLNLAEQFVKSLRSEFMTTIEQDEQLLEKSKKHEMKVAIKLRMIYKQILDEQLKIIHKCQNYLKFWKQGKLLIGSKQGLPQKQMKWIKKVREYFNSLQRGKV